MITHALAATFEIAKHMESFELNINSECFKIRRDKFLNNKFNVFNHTTFHVIRKNEFGQWQSIEHRFGKDNLPISQIGYAIDQILENLHKQDNF